MTLKGYILLFSVNKRTELAICVHVHHNLGDSFLLLHFLTILSASTETLGISEDRFKCHDGNFIDINLKCNQVYNCPDQSDEAFETCYNTSCNEDDEFKCGNGGCIPIKSSCNGAKECLDGSDENKFVCINETTNDAVLREFRGFCGLV